VNVFSFIPGYESYIYNEGKEPLLFLFLAFLITFALTRVYTRLARTRGWGSGSAGGVHMHHMVPGIILMSVAGILAFTQFADNEVVEEVAAILFGAGLALTLDEFAMIFHLKDVYWSEEGRTSIDALLMGVAGSGLLLVSSAPTSGEPALVLEFGSFRLEFGLFIAIAINLVLSAITFLKKKPFLGTVSILVIFVGMVTAVRLGKPGSPWAHWFYDPDRGRERFRKRRARKAERSLRRFTVGWSGQFERWFSDLVGGAPTAPDGPERPAAERAQADGSQRPDGAAFH
jgi:tryptophan-rich sensory protein